VDKFTASKYTGSTGKKMSVSGGAVIWPFHLFPIVLLSPYFMSWRQIFLTAPFLVLVPGNLQGRGALLPGRNGLVALIREKIGVKRYRCHACSIIFISFSFVEITGRTELIPYFPLAVFSNDGH